MKHYSVKTSLGRRRRSVDYKWIRIVAIGLVITCVGFGIKSIDFLALNQQFHRYLNVLMVKHGLVIEEIFVEGRCYEDPENIRNAIGLKKGDSIFHDSPFHIKQRLEILSWVRSASVQRVLPNLLYIKLVERQPIALWQYKGRLFLIDTEGKVIDSDKLTLFKNLPLFVGEGANLGVSSFIEKIKKFPVLKEEWTTAIRVGGRRWDLKLRNGLKVYLPIEEIDKSLQELEKLCQEKNVLKKEIVSVDLRVVDRVILGLSTPGIIQTRFHTTKAKKV